MPSRPNRASSRRSSAANNWVQEIDRLYTLAEFAEAAQIFDSADVSHPPYGTILKRARIYVKRDFAEALRFLIDRPAPKSDPAAQAEQQMLFGMAYDRIGNHKLAAERFREAERLASVAKRRDLQQEIPYWRARGHLLQGDIESAEKLLPTLSRANVRIARIRYLDLQSLVHGRRQRYPDQARALMDLIAIADDARDDVPESRVWATHTLAGLAREIYLPEARPIIVAQLEKRWPAYFRENQFQTQKALAWVCALQGDYFNAFRYLKYATAAAPNKAWKMMALLDRSYLARCTGEILWSRQELSEAEEVADHVDWRTVDDEARIALLLFAELFASLDRGKAAYFLAKFGKVGRAEDPLLNLQAEDGRLAAITGYVHGVVELAMGHRKLGLHSLRESFAIFDRIGFDWRAGRTALQIYGATHDPVMLTSAREKLRRYASSWLGEELMKRTRGGADLTPMQEKIFGEICKGLSTSEIAERLGRSEFTIRNHLKLVFLAFGVNSRTALLAEASRRGLLPKY